MGKLALSLKLSEIHFCSYIVEQIASYLVVGGLVLLILGVILAFLPIKRIQSRYFAEKYVCPTLVSGFSLLSVAFIFVLLTMGSTHIDVGWNEYYHNLYYHHGAK